MMINIKLDINQLDSIVRAWLKDTLKMAESGISSDYLHPDDIKEYQKDIKALKRILEYIGDGK